MTHNVILYKREGCCLCERARKILGQLQGEFALAIQEIDITTDPELYQQYRYTVPVVVIDGEHRFEPNKLAEFYLRRVLETSERNRRRWPWQRKAAEGPLQSDSGHERQLS